jgi:hypothetical protein
MRNRTRNRIYFAIQALAAAWLVTWIGVPSASGDQTSASTVTAAGAFADDGSTANFNHRPVDPFRLPPPPSGPLPIPYPNLRLLFSHFPIGSWLTDHRSPHTPSLTASVLDGPFMQLASSSVAGTTSLGSITMSGSNGSYLAQTITVTGAAETAGALTVNGFNPANDEEIYGLAATTNNLATLISELNSAVGAEDTGATATTVPANLALVLSGDNIAVIFPHNGTSPNIFSYNLVGDTTSASITSITVVPEPAAVSALILGAVGLIGRRKRPRIS